VMALQRAAVMVVPFTTAVVVMAIVVVVLVIRWPARRHIVAHVESPFSRPDSAAGRQDRHRGHQRIEPTRFSLFDAPLIRRKSNRI
jgi:hypothetical protein